MTVDLRSDTVTTPTAEMYEAMRNAPLGDDVLGHDPTVFELETIAAKIVGMESAIFVPSGTMSNQVALATHTNPGDSVLFDDDAHMLFYEGAAPSIFAGVQARTVPSNLGVMDPSLIVQRALVKSHHTPGTTLLCLENSHNRSGGQVASVELHQAYRVAANELGIPIHLDGARVFNAATSLGVDIQSITRNVDSVSVCLSKGLASPVGSVLCGSSDFIERAKFWRKRMGGGLRQAGILAACGIVSLTKMVERLSEDHDRCMKLYEALCHRPDLEPVKPKTNILMIDVNEPGSAWVSRLAEKGIDLVAMGPNRLRAVFHKDIDDNGLFQTIDAFKAVAF